METKNRTVKGQPWVGHQKERGCGKSTDWAWGIRKTSKHHAQKAWFIADGNVQFYKFWVIEFKNFNAEHEKNVRCEVTFMSLSLELGSAELVLSCFSCIRQCASGFLGSSQMSNPCCDAQHHYNSSLERLLLTHPSDHPQQYGVGSRSFRKCTNILGGLASADLTFALGIQVSNHTWET